jgi:glycosyltransferase involved in cell wall biosynthesis
VDVDSFYWRPPEDYFLVVAELVPYKRVDSAVRLFSRSGRRLRIAGSGPELRVLKRSAAANVEFLGRVSDHDLRELYAHCRAFLLPGEEDFGMTPVEALASGKPVIALGRGGALESVPPFGGVFYGEPSEEQLARAIERFEAMEPAIVPADLQEHARRFSEAEFRRKMSLVLESATGR